MWSRQSASAKLRTTKFSSEGLEGNSAKFCTSENFLLYGIQNAMKMIVVIILIIGKLVCALSPKK